MPTPTLDTLLPLANRCRDESSLDTAGTSACATLLSRDKDGRRGARDASDGDYDGLRSERCRCRDAQVDLRHADQGGGDTVEQDGARAGRNAADGNRGRLHGDGQQRDGGPGGRGRAGGHGRRNGAHPGKVQSQHAAARHRCSGHDGSAHIREQAGRGGGDRQRGGGDAAVVVDSYDARLIHRRLVGNLHVELCGRDVVERGVDTCNGDAESGYLTGERHGGGDPGCVPEVRPEDGEHRSRSISLTERGAVRQTADARRTGRRDGDADGPGGGIQRGIARVLSHDVVGADLELRGGYRDAGGGGRPRAAERRDADLRAARRERDGAGGGGAAGAGYGRGDSDRTGGHYRGRRRLQGHGRGRPGGKAGAPARHQIVGVHRTESAGLVIALPRRVAKRAGDAVARARSAGRGDDVVAGGNIVKRAGPALGQGVEARVNIAGSGGGLSAGGHQILIEQRDNSGEGGRASGSSSEDGERAGGATAGAGGAIARVNHVPVVIGRCCHGDIGNVTRAVVRHTQTSLPRGVGENSAGAAATRRRIARRAVIPHDLGNVRDGRPPVGVVGRVPVLAQAFAEGGAADAGDFGDVGGRVDRQSRAAAGSAGTGNRITIVAAGIAGRDRKST